MTTVTQSAKGQVHFRLGKSISEAVLRNLGPAWGDKLQGEERNTANKVPELFFALQFSENETFKGICRHRQSNSGWHVVKRSIVDKHAGLNFLTVVLNGTRCSFFNLRTVTSCGAPVKMKKNPEMII